MLGQTVKKQTLFTFTDYLLQFFSPENPYHRELFASGLRLYRDGYVYNVREEDGILYGVVETPHGKVTVQLGLQNHDQTTCSCTSAHYCEHIFAVLYYAYATICGIGELLAKWKENTQTPKKALKIMKPTLQTTAAENPDTWEEIFTTQHEHFQREVVRPTPFDYYYRFLGKIIEVAPQDETLHLLYRLHMSFVTLSLMYETIAKDDIGGTFSNQHIVSRLEQELTEYIEQLAFADLSSYESLLQNILHVVETMIEENESLPLRLFNQYRDLWMFASEHTTLLPSAMALLEKEKARGVRSQWYDFKLSHFYVLTGQDEKAQALLEPYLTTPGFVFYWIDYHLEREQWEIAEKWLFYVHPAIKETKGDSKTRMLLGHYLNYYLEIPYFSDHYDVEKIFKDLWPVSISYYETYLIGAKKYDRWVELSAYSGVDPLYERKEYIKMIEKEAPHTLLPLYHQRVVIEVGKKNRSSYKVAIRYLKKLRTLYRKQKRLDYFQQYITEVTRSTSRLRAFQEELRKGGFIEN